MKSEHQIQDEIKLDLCNKDGFCVRCNAGKFWQGERVWSYEFQEYVIRHPRIVVGLPTGFSDLLYIGKKQIAFIEVKDHIGKPNKDQKAFLKRVSELGHNAGIARSIEEARDIVNGFKARE